MDMVNMLCLIVAKEKYDEAKKLKTPESKKAFLNVLTNLENEDLKLLKKFVRNKAKLWVKEFKGYAKLEKRL